MPDAVTNENLYKLSGKRVAVDASLDPLPTILGSQVRFLRTQKVRLHHILQGRLLQNHELYVIEHRDDIRL